MSIAVGLRSLRQTTFAIALGLGAAQGFAPHGAHADSRAQATFQPVAQTVIPKQTMQVPPLLGAKDLAKLLTISPAHVVDIRQPRARRPLYSYAAGHVPGAVNVPYGKWRAIWSDPLAVPSDADLTEAIQSAGLTKDRPVVIVHSSASQGNFGSAAWVYWVLKSAGFTNIAILNGGIRAWEASGGEMSTLSSPVIRSDEVVALNDTWLATHEDVDDVINGESDAQLLDARPLHQIMEEASIEGSFTLNAEELLTGKNGAAADDLSIFMRIKQAGLEWEYGDVITYCNNGALAAVDWFMANEIAGIPNVKVYGHSLKARRKALATH